MKLPGVGLPLPESTTELTRLRSQLEDLRASFSAIRNGGVDGIMGGDPNDQKLYTLTSADRPYRVIVEEMGEGAATVSERGVLLYVNRRLAGLVGREPRDLIGSDAAALVAGHDRAAFDEQLSITAGQTRRAELSLIRGDGSQFLAMTSATGLGIDGVLVRCLVVSDLTERRRVERQIADANARVAEHAADVERANTDLARSNEDLAQFAYAASHDLAEPLRSISGFADLLRLRCRGKLDEDADDYIDFITSGAVRMQQLINDLLSYSRVGTRVQPLEPVAVEQVMQDALADLNTRLVETQADVRVDPLPLVNADRTQLTKVFANLIRNAVTFVSPGTTPAVHVFADHDGGGWRFTVADNGIGIRAEHRQRVFGMFKRLHGRDAYPGTGVGLAIVQKVVQRHGGETWIEDNPGGGSRFIFTIPDRLPAPEPLHADGADDTDLTVGR